MALHEQQLKHIKTWQASGASKTVYCQNIVDLGQFVQSHDVY
jgi:hypothetical protein